MEYYLVMKKKRILPFAATWVNLGDIMLNEISQTEKDKYLYVESRKKHNKLVNKTKKKLTHRYREQTS